MPLRALIVHDDRRGADPASELGGRGLVAERASSLVEVRAALARGGWDAILTDNALPGLAAHDLRAIAGELGLDVPVIAIAGAGANGESHGVQAELRAAAERYRQLFESSPLPMWVFDTGTL